MRLTAGGVTSICRLDNDDNYWEQERYPDWAELNILKLFTNQKAGWGVEPHFHDGDEYWLFVEGEGEVWLGREDYEVTPNTLVYTPAGVTHRHQMFTPHVVAAAVTPLFGEKRPGHLPPTQPDQDVPSPGRISTANKAPKSGSPRIDVTSTGAGFVLPGSGNLTCDLPAGPLSELRCVANPGGSAAREEASASANQYFLVAAGSAVVSTDGVAVQLGAGDLAIVRAGSRVVLDLTEPSLLVKAQGRGG